MYRPREPPFMFHVKHLFIERSIFMKNRAATNPTVDRQIFRRTAVKVKAVNLPQKAYRGGIRF